MILVTARISIFMNIAAGLATIGYLFYPNDRLYLMTGIIVLYAFSFIRATYVIFKEFPKSIRAQQSIHKAINTPYLTKTEYFYVSPKHHHYCIYSVDELLNMTIGYFISEDGSFCLLSKITTPDAWYLKEDEILITVVSVQSDGGISCYPDNSIIHEYYKTNPTVRADVIPDLQDWLDLNGFSFALGKLYTGN